MANAPCDRCRRTLHRGVEGYPRQDRGEAAALSQSYLTLMTSLYNG